MPIHCCSDLLIAPSLQPHDAVTSHPKRLLQCRWWCMVFWTGNFHLSNAHRASFHRKFWTCFLACAVAMMFVRLSVRLSGTGVHCDHTVHFSTDLSVWLDSPVFWTPWHQSMSTYSQPSFSSSTWKRGAVWMCKLGVISQERLKIEVRWLLSANRKSYMPRRLAQQRMTLSDLEWQFHQHRLQSLR